MCDVVPSVSVSSEIIAVVYSHPPSKKKASVSRNRRLGDDEEEKLVEWQRR